MGGGRQGGAPAPGRQPAWGSLKCLWETLGLLPPLQGCRWLSNTSPLDGRLALAASQQRLAFLSRKNPHVCSLPGRVALSCFSSTGTWEKWDLRLGTWSQRGQK